MSVLCFVEGGEIEFFNTKDVKDFFGLDEISDKDFSQIDGKHICVDPYSEDIYNSRVLMWSDTAESLAESYREYCNDI